MGVTNVCHGGYRVGSWFYSCHDTRGLVGLCLGRGFGLNRGMEDVRSRGSVMRFWVCKLW